MLPLELDNMATMGPKASEPQGISAGGTSAFANKKNWKEFSLTSLVPLTPTPNSWYFFSLNCAFSASCQSPSVGSRENGPSRSRKPALFPAAVRSPCQSITSEAWREGCHGSQTLRCESLPLCPGCQEAWVWQGQERRNDLWEETWLHFCSFGLSAGLICYSN